MCEIILPSLLVRTKPVWVVHQLVWYEYSILLPHKPWACLHESVRVHMSITGPGGTPDQQSQYNWELRKEHLHLDDQVETVLWHAYKYGYFIISFHFVVRQYYTVYICYHQQYTELYKACKYSKPPCQNLYLHTLYSYYMQLLFVIIVSNIICSVPCKKVTGIITVTFIVFSMSKYSI